MKRKMILLFIIVITFVMVKDVYAEKFNGEYSIDYLLRNYSAVTFNNKKYNIPSSVYYTLNNYSEGSVYNLHNAEGAVLISGNYISDSPAQFDTAGGNVKSYIGGGVQNVQSANEFNFVTEPEYVDFDKLYINVVNESQKLAESSEYNINDSKVEISKPGIYSVNNTALFYSNHSANPIENNKTRFYNNRIFINNYDRNSYYVFNYYDEYIESLPDVYISDNSSPTAVSIAELANSGGYSGNIIFNFPNAKYIRSRFESETFYLLHKIDYSTNFSGNIIAPKAYVDIKHNNVNINQLNSMIYGTIIANTISFDYSKFYNNRIGYDVKTVLKKCNYNVNKDLIDNKLDYIVEPKDYSDDIYTRDYSIKDLLQNYNVVTLGHKQLDSKTKLSNAGYRSGSVRLFHITGQSLINGDLYSNVYENEIDDFRRDEAYANYTYQKFDRVNFDLESNKVTETFIKGNVLREVKETIEKNDNTHAILTFTLRLGIPVIQPWDNMENDNLEFHLKKNKIFTGEQSYSSYSVYAGRGNFSGSVDNYLNFDRLYNNVVAEQKGIEEGDKVKASNGVAHIPIGGNYVIDDISDINKIVFDNFEDNSKMITVVTINNSGDINFPEINKDKGYYKGIVTNDYYGKKQATHLYERDTFITNDDYYGNIIFNVPNATYIKLKENVPFAGHLIAPNADVETEETHFAGCFIVNSIYGEGNTEAHFYPLTVYDNCECSVEDQVPEGLQARFNELRLNRLLGGETSIVETNVLGNHVQYKNDTDKLNEIIDNCPMRKHSPSLVEILSNPPTYGTIGGVLLIIIGLIIGSSIYKKNNKNTN